jgi:hypothetical protein
MAEYSDHNALVQLLKEHYGNGSSYQAPAPSMPGVTLTDPKRSEGGFYRPNGDHAYYLPEGLVGDLPYRYQGVGLHGGIAAYGAASALDGLASKLAGGRMGGPGWLGLVTALANAAYVAWTIGSGRTAPKPKVNDPMPANDLASILSNRYGEGYRNPLLELDSADHDTRNVLDRMK